MTDDQIFLICGAIVGCVAVLCITKCTMHQDKLSYEKFKIEHAIKP